MLARPFRRAESSGYNKRMRFLGTAAASLCVLLTAQAQPHSSAQALAALGRAEEAISTLEMVLRKDPRHLAAHRLLATP